jgi:hypothetical protein
VLERLIEGDPVAFSEILRRGDAQRPLEPQVGQRQAGDRLVAELGLSLREDSQLGRALDGLQAGEPLTDLVAEPPGTGLGERRFPELTRPPLP